MAHAPFRRGSVLLRDGKYGVVWTISGDRVELIPAVVPDERYANDLVLSPAERVEAGIALRGAVLRPKDRVTVSVAGQHLVGELFGKANCRLTLTMIRTNQDEAVHDRWASDRQHRRKAAVPGAQISRAGRRVMNTV